MVHNVLMSDLFEKNLAIFTSDEKDLLKEKKVLVVGCGGLGGSVIELLARSGIGRLVLADMDVFEPSNMNRQILCTVDTLGKGKAETAAARVLSINPEADVQAVTERLSEDNAPGLIRDCDIVIDALDSVASRLMLEEACAKENKYLIHGAVSGFALQIGVCPPGSGMLQTLYGGKNATAHAGGGIAMTVFSCASFEVSEAIKILLGRPDSLSGNFLFFDLLSKESQIIPML